MCKCTVFSVDYNSMKVWKNLYIDPNYTIPMKENDNGEREGSFNLSLSYKF